MSSKPYIGIDLGTTNSVISFAQVMPNGAVKANPISIDRITDMCEGIDGKSVRSVKSGTTLPSYVYYESKDKYFVGDYARDQYKKSPDRVAKSIKSQMGNQRVRGLAEDIPDESPEAISARILRHLIMGGSQKIRKTIDKAIITIPSNFDIAKCQATIRAAEIAGLDADASILISEPTAVLYDLSQKIQNGEVAASVIDLDEKKRVLIFDFGGGTLDVTVHEIERDPENRSALVISEIAKARYTELGGDDFDLAISNELYRRCIEIFKRVDPDVVQRIESREAIVKKLLAVAAEQIKIHMSTSVVSDYFGGNDWFGESDFEDDGETTYTISQAIYDEYMYNDTITKSEFEAILEPFMARELTYSDYRTYTPDRTKGKKNILAPIMDVLSMADRYYNGNKNGDMVKIDAVILNGGMSKLYMIKDRLQEFFGIEPITTADPDLSVANGAAIYATLVDECGIGDRNSISVKRHVQNDDIYIGLSAGVNDQLILAGSEIPYTKEIEGYKILPHTSTIEIPIKRGMPTGEPQTIARGIISFNRTYPKPMDLKMEASFDQMGILTIKAFLMNDSAVEVSRGQVRFALGEPAESCSGGSRIIPADGTRLVAANELDHLRSFFSDKNKNKNKFNATKSKMETIMNCGNPEDFEDVILKHLSKEPLYGYRIHLYKLVKALAPAWTKDGIEQLREIAARDIISEEFALNVNSSRIELSDTAKEVLASL